MADKIVVEGFVPLTKTILKSDKYLETPLVEITLCGVTSYGNKASIRVKRDDLEEALEKLRKEER